MKKIIFWLLFACASNGNTSNLVEESTETINRNQQFEIEQIYVALKEIETTIKPEIKLSLELFDKSFKDLTLDVHQLCGSLGAEKKKLLNCMEKCSTPSIYTILLNPQEMHQQFLLDQKTFQTFKASITNFIRNIYVDFFSPDYILNSLMPVTPEMMKREIYKIEMLSIYVDCLIVNIKFYKKALKKQMIEKIKN